jgi:hypothetical protein
MSGAVNPHLHFITTIFNSIALHQATKRHFWQRTTQVSLLQGFQPLLKHKLPRNALLQHASSAAHFMQNTAAAFL